LDWQNGEADSAKDGGEEENALFAGGIFLVGIFLVGIF
jgi:hypothetical protein